MSQKIISSDELSIIAKAFIEWVDTKANPQAIVEMLHEQNIASINSYYDEKLKLQQPKYKDVELPAKKVIEDITDSYKYNSSNGEFDDYENTKAYQITGKIIKKSRYETSPFSEAEDGEGVNARIKEKKDN
jgi:ABC-type glycerol-3-phosphate transport system substrate-binding protein